VGRALRRLTVPRKATCGAGPSQIAAALGLKVSLVPRSDDERLEVAARREQTVAVA